MSGQYFAAKSHVNTYSKFRPVPPMNMIEKIVQFTAEKFSGPLQLAIDVGCGSGQSTEVFAPYFVRVLGIDSNLSIINEAKLKCQYSNVNYSQSFANSIPAEDESASLLSVCQALHWFDIEKFYAEAKRVLCKNGVLAVYGYNLPVPLVEDADEKLTSIVQRYYENELGDYVLPESRKAYIESYNSKEFYEVPFVYGRKLERSENFVTETESSITDLKGYISSWSTYQNYLKHVGEVKAQDILKKFEYDFKNLIYREIHTDEKFKIKYNYFLLLGRKVDFL